MENLSNNLQGEKIKNGFWLKSLYTSLAIMAWSYCSSVLKAVIGVSYVYAFISYILFFATIYLCYRKIWRNKKIEKLPDIKEEVRNDYSISINGAVSIPNPYTGVLIVGGAGSGKSKSIVEPIIYDAGRLSFTGIVYDFKFPTLAKHVAKAYRDNHDIKKYYINFSDLEYSNTVNPVSARIMTNSSFAREFANTILSNINPQSISKPDFWSDNSQTFLASVLWFLREERPEYCTLPHAMSMILASDTEGLIRLLKTNPQSKDMVQPIATAFDAGSSNQIAGVVSSLQVSLSKINTPEVCWVMGNEKGSCDLDLNNPQSPGILTIGNDPVLSNTYSPVIGLVMAAGAKLLNRQDKLKSLLLVDEFPTIYIPNVEQLPATARSNKVATILACQDITQIIDKYGKQKCDTVLSNLGNQFYGRTSNPDTAQRVSKLFGKVDRLMESTSANYTSGAFKLKRGTSNSFSYQERDIVKPQDVTVLQTGSFYVLLSEGANKQGKINVKITNDEDTNSLSLISKVTPQAVNENFVRIKMEAEAIINGLL